MLLMYVYIQVTVPCFHYFVIVHYVHHASWFSFAISRQSWQRYHPTSTSTCFRCCPSVATSNSLVDRASQLVAMVAARRSAIL